MHTTKDDEPHKEGELTSYSQVVSYLLPTSATNDMIAKVEAKITNFKQENYMFSIT